MIKKIGFACKWSERDGKGQVVSLPELNTKVTTVAWLKRQSRDAAEQRLWDLMVHNIESTRKLVEKIGTLDEHLRMVRLSSDILPAYTEPTYGSFYGRLDVQDYASAHFSEVGRLARDRDVRLSFHPGQFCVLASSDNAIVHRSIEEFEYHVDMARWMGYGKTFQDLKINVHIAGRQGPDGIRKVLGRLTPEARNTLTIENEEISHGLNDCLLLADVVPIVLDVHHHWIREGEYIKPSDDRVKMVVDSWRGIRPTLHYSVSREDVLVDHDATLMPDMIQLLTEGKKKQKLRAHSEFYWNEPVNDWAVSFLETHDIMCESKAKNLASFELAKHAKKLNLI
jgi:UV DNA damage repair endonuclease